MPKITCIVSAAPVVPAPRVTLFLLPRRISAAMCMASSGSRARSCRCLRFRNCRRRVRRLTFRASLRRTAGGRAQLPRIARHHRTALALRIAGAPRVVRHSTDPPMAAASRRMAQVPLGPRIVHSGQRLAQSQRIAAQSLHLAALRAPHHPVAPRQDVPSVNQAASVAVHAGQAPVLPAQVDIRGDRVFNISPSLV